MGRRIEIVHSNLFVIDFSVNFFYQLVWRYQLADVGRGRSLAEYGNIVEYETIVSVYASAADLFGNSNSDFVLYEIISDS